MNLVASAMLRGMVGASSSSDLLVDSRKEKSRSDSTNADRAAEALKASVHTQDAREALKGAQSESGVSYNAQRQQTMLKWRLPGGHADSDAVELSDAGKAAPGADASKAQPGHQDTPKLNAVGGKLSIKI